MLYINSISIKNFQSHKYTRLDFEPGLNVIVGPSDQGKSSIIRAINWVLFNEPRGTDFIRQGASECSVTLFLSNGYSITRLRSSSKNQYIITLPDGKRQVFEGFGTGVPLEVQNTHNIKRVLIDVDAPRAVNIAHQLESPFLITETGSTRAKAIGRMVGVHILDRASRETERDLTRLQSSLKSLKEQLLDVSEKLKEFQGLDDLKREIEARERLVYKIKELESRENKLIEYNKQLRDIIQEEAKVKLTINMLCNLPLVETLLYKVQGLTERYRSLTRSSEQLNLVNKRISQISYTLKSYPDMEKVKKAVEQLTLLQLRLKTLQEKYTVFSKVTSSILSLKKTLAFLNKADNISRDLYPVLEYKYQRLSILLEKHEYLQVLEQKIGTGHEYIEKKEQEISSLLEEYRQLLKELGRCPLCLQEINDETVYRILKEDHYERL